MPDVRVLRPRRAQTLLREKLSASWSRWTKAMVCGPSKNSAEPPNTRRGGGKRGRIRRARAREVEEEEEEEEEGEASERRWRRDPKTWTPSS